MRKRCSARWPCCGAALHQFRVAAQVFGWLLTATSLGLASCPLTEPLEVRDARDHIRTEVLGDSGFPQLIVRIGFAATSAEPVPQTPRRPIDEIVRPL
ncbi:hypothetical protein [Nocardia blacklockiae]|uniref:hypothetical protein n=1 Tax=Nocardia blacklockiae TaxID=480036 RepID=UPI0018957BC0|nr:hypothetical protein [Nocardia blacklockiae]MBF6176636.1 hypothetical protein [Nocardia blacklockiae]